MQWHGKFVLGRWPALSSINWVRMIETIQGRLGRDDREIAVERLFVLKPRGGGGERHRLNYIKIDGVLWIVDVQRSELNLCKCTGVNSIHGIQMLPVMLQRLDNIRRHARADAEETSRALQMTPCDASHSKTRDGYRGRRQCQNDVDGVNLDRAMMTFKCSKRVNQSHSCHTPDDT